MDGICILMNVPAKAASSGSIWKSNSTCSEIHLSKYLNRVQESPVKYQEIAMGIETSETMNSAVCVSIPTSL
jgi:hypothetical protein